MICAERRELDPADVDAVDLDRSGVDVVQPRDQVGRRRLARARRPDERDELARLRLEVDVLERERREQLDRGQRRRHRRRRLEPTSASTAVLVDLGGGERLCRPPRLRGDRRPARRAASCARAERHRLGRVAERHVAEADLAADIARVERDRVGRVDDLGVHLEVFEDPVEQGQRALDLDLDVEQLAEREEQAALERRERDDRAGGRRRSGRRSRPASRRASTRTPA